MKAWCQEKDEDIKQVFERLFQRYRDEAFKAQVLSPRVLQLRSRVSLGNVHRIVRRTNKEWYQEQQHFSYIPLLPIDFHQILIDQPLSPSGSS